MTAVLRSIDLRPAWKALEAHHQKVRNCISASHSRMTAHTMTSESRLLQLTMSRSGNLCHRIRRDAASCSGSAGDHQSRLGRSTTSTSWTSLSPLRYPDGSFALNGEPFSVWTSVFSGTAASFRAGLALSVPPLSSSAVDSMLASVG